MHYEAPEPRGRQGLDVHRGPRCLSDAPGWRYVKEPVFFQWEKCLWYVFHGAFFVRFLVGFVGFWIFFGLLVLWLFRCSFDAGPTIAPQPVTHPALQFFPALAAAALTLPWRLPVNAQLGKPFQPLDLWRIYSANRELAIC